MNFALFCKSTETVISTAVLLWFVLWFFFSFVALINEPLICAVQ